MPSPYLSQCFHLRHPSDPAGSRGEHTFRWDAVPIAEDSSATKIPASFAAAHPDARDVWLPPLIPLACRIHTPELELLQNLQKHPPARCISAPANAHCTRLHWSLFLSTRPNADRDPDQSTRLRRSNEPAAERALTLANLPRHLAHASDPHRLARSGSIKVKSPGSSPSLCFGLARYRAPAGSPNLPS